VRRGYDGGTLPTKDVRRMDGKRERSFEDGVRAVAGRTPAALARLGRIDLADLMALREQVLHHLDGLELPKGPPAYVRGIWVHTLAMQRALDGPDAREALAVALEADDDGPVLALLDLDEGDVVDEDFVLGFGDANVELSQFVDALLGPAARI